MTAPPADFGAYVIAALPYAGIEALRIAAWCIAVIIPAAVAWRTLAGAHRPARQPTTPGIRHLHRTAVNAHDRSEPVTRPMSAAELDAIHGPRLGDLTGPDHMVTGQLAAVQDTLTPRMVAPTRADLTTVRQRCTRCRTGNPQLPCMCGYDCYAVDCLADTPGASL